MQTIARKLVLVAEDDREVRESAALALRRSGYGVLEAGDGLEAVEIAAKHGPDLAVVDVALPRRIAAPAIPLATDASVLRAAVAEALAG